VDKLDNQNNTNHSRLLNQKRKSTVVDDTNLDLLLEIFPPTALDTIILLNTVSFLSSVFRLADMDLKFQMFENRPISTLYAVHDI